MKIAPDNKAIKQNNNTNQHIRKIRFSKKQLNLIRLFLQITEKQAHSDPKACFEITGTKAIHRNPEIKLIQIYEAVAELRRLNGEDFIINKPLNTAGKGKKAGFYYIPDKYRRLAEKAVGEELNKLSNKQG